MSQYYSVAKDPNRLVSIRTQSDARVELWRVDNRLELEVDGERALMTYDEAAELYAALERALPVEWE
jgi:hypothetical protein